MQVRKDGGRERRGSNSVVLCLKVVLWRGRERERERKRERVRVKRERDRQRENLPLYKHHEGKIPYSTQAMEARVDDPNKIIKINAKRAGKEVVHGENEGHSSVRYKQHTGPFRGDL